MCDEKYIFVLFSDILLIKTLVSRKNIVLMFCRGLNWRSPKKQIVTGPQLEVLIIVQARTRRKMNVQLCDKDLIQIL